MAADSIRAMLKWFSASAIAVSDSIGPSDGQDRQND